MAHPFFDAFKFPKERPEAQALVSALVQARGARNKYTLLYERAWPEASPLTEGIQADFAWLEIFDNLTMAGRLRHFCEVVLADASLVQIHPLVRVVLDAPDDLTVPLLRQEGVILDRNLQQAEQNRSGLTRLAQTVQRLPDDQPADTVEQMARETEIREAPSAGDLRESRRQERSHKDMPEAGFSQNRRETTEATSEQAAVVAVRSALLERLQEHQERLGEYIQAYISFQAFNDRCRRQVSDLDDARSRPLNTSDWESIRIFLIEVSVAVSGLGSSFTDDSEFSGFLKRLRRAVTKAKDAAMDPAAQARPNETARKLNPHLMVMRYTLDEIVTLCPRKANVTLGQLRDGINQILGQVERQREARQNASSAATKGWRQPPSTTDTTVRKAV